MAPLRGNLGRLIATPGSGSGVASRGPPRKTLSAEKPGRTFPGPWSADPEREGARSADLARGPGRRAGVSGTEAKASKTAILSMLVQSKNLFGVLVPDLGDQDRLVGEQPDPDHGHPPVEAGRPSVRVGRRN
jgi:hypothetical protein